MEKIHAADVTIEVPKPPAVKIESIGKLISSGIQILLIVAGLAAFFYLLLGGFQWITSGGDKDRTAGAQKTLTAALVGLVIVFAAWAIIKLIQTFFGIEILQLKIPTV